MATRTKNQPHKLAPGPYEAVVVGHMDASYSGILKVELLSKTSTGGDPGRSGQVIEARYMSPFYGVTPQSQTTGRSGYQDTQKSYGMWMIPPDVGTRVIVILIEGNTSQAYWIGCVQDRYMNFMTPGYAATKQVESLTGDPTGQVSKKVPVAEYNKYREEATGRNPTKYLKPPHTDIARGLQNQGLIDDDIRGTTSSSARREVPSAVFGISTPGPVDKRDKAPRARVGNGVDTGQANPFVSRLGGSSFVMDDGDDKLLRKGPAATTPPEYENIEARESGDPREGEVTLPANELVRIRTRTGHQILLHNTEDLIYIGNARGTSWIELTSNGKIDIYAEDSISVHTANDINFTADRDINFTAGENVNWVVGKQVRVTAGESINNIAGTNHSTTAGQSISEIAGTDISNYANKKASYQAIKDLAVIGGRQVSVSSGGIVGLDAGRILNLYSNGDAMLIADQKLSVRATNDTQIRLGNVYADTGDFHLKLGEYSSILGEGIINVGSKEFYLNTETRCELNSDGDLYSLVDGNTSLRAGGIVKLQSEFEDVQIRAEENIVVFAKEGNIEALAGDEIVQEATNDLILTATDISIVSGGRETEEGTSKGSIVIESTESLILRSDDALGIESSSTIDILADEKISIDGSITDVQSGAATIPEIDAKDSDLFERGQDEVERLVSYIKWHKYDLPNQPFVVVNDTFPQPVFPAHPTPALYADRVARIPMHEPWYQHENSNPPEFTPDKTRAGSELPDVYRVEIPDTFSTLPVKQDELGTLRVSAKFEINDSNFFSKIQFTAPPAGEVDEFVEIASRMGISPSLSKAVIAVLVSQYGEFSHTLTEQPPSADGPIEEVAELVRKRYHNLVDKTDDEIVAAVQGNFFYEVYGHMTDYGKAIGNIKADDADSYSGRGYYLGIVGRGLWSKLMLANNHSFAMEFLPDSAPSDKKMLQFCFARFIQQFYKDHGRGTLGNARIMLFGSEDYSLAHKRDQFVFDSVYNS